MRPVHALLGTLALASLVVTGLLLQGPGRLSQGGLPSGPIEEPGAPADSRAPLADVAPPRAEPAAVTAPEAPPPPAQGTIRGRVVGGAPELLGALEVQATALDGVTPARSARCDLQGRFELAGLAPGTTYHLRGLAAGRSSFGRSRTEVRTARTGDANVELPLLPERALVFQVVDARTGLALTDFEVRLGRGFARPLLDADGFVRSAFPDGRVRWTSWAPEEASEAVALVVSARGYRELRQEDLLAPLAADLDLGRLPLEPLPRLIVLVQDAETRRGIRNALVSLEAEGNGARPPGSQAFDPYSGRTDAEGRVLLTSLPGQEVLLRVRHPEYHELERALALGLAEQQVESVGLTRR